MKHPPKKGRTKTKAHLFAYFPSATDLINDASDKKNLTIFEGESTVISCPISSVPEANFSWYFNNNEMNFDAGLKQKDIR
jgi:hypothetical protein